MRAEAFEQTTFPSMPGARLTNNSAATLEEQTLIIRMMSEKGVRPARSGGSVKDPEKKEKERKKKSQTDKAPAAKGASQSGDNVATVTSARPERPDKVARKPAEALGRDPDAGHEEDLAELEEGLGEEQQIVQQPLPMYFQQPFPQFYPQPMGVYNGFGAQMGPQLGQPLLAGPMGDAGAADQQSEDGWDRQHRAAHEISDDEDDISIISDQPKVHTEKLDFSGLKAGKLAELLKTRHERVSEADRLGPEINGTLAKIIDAFFEEVKPTGEIEKLVKEYPKVKNLEKVAVPKLENELFSAIDQNTRMTDVALQLLQKALVASISAMAPIAALALERGAEDEQLDELSSNVMDSIHLMALANSGISSRRREIIKPHLQITYAKAMAKNHGGEPQWLFGGNLTETTRKCEAEKRVTEKILKRKTNTQQQGAGAAGQAQKTQGQRQNKRFKPYNNNASWQQPQAYGAKTFGYQHYPQVYQGGQTFQPMPQQYFPQQQGQYQQQQFQQQQFRPKGQKQQGQNNGGRGGQDFQKKGPRF